MTEVENWSDDASPSDLKLNDQAFSLIILLKREKLEVLKRSYATVLPSQMSVAFSRFPTFHEFHFFHSVFDLFNCREERQNAFVVSRP